MLDRKFEKGYTERGQTFFKNRIDATFQAPTVQCLEAAGCKVILSFAQEENPDVEKQIMQILEHGLLRRLSIGGN